MQDDYDFGEEDNPWLSLNNPGGKYENLVQKNLSAITQFLGDGPCFVDIFADSIA